MKHEVYTCDICGHTANTVEVKASGRWVHVYAEPIPKHPDATPRANTRGTAYDLCPSCAAHAFTIKPGGAR